MPVCRQCGKQWPDTYAVCPEDGLRLSAISQPTVAGSTGSLALDTARTSADDDLAPGTVAGEYVIEQKLGQGGMGAVYGARHPLIGKRAAVKVISRDLSASEEAVDRFVREAQAVNQIGHPNIVDVFGFGRLADGRSFFVMEWLVGETLRARMMRPLTLADALEILDQVAMALEAAHDAGVLHRDLKPDNVFLVAHKGRVNESMSGAPVPPKIKLLDFGLAKLHGGADGRIDHTRTGVVMGTPLYLSPEQAKGIKVDFPADIYSLGAIAYEMCTGHVPFIADSAVEIMAKHISERAVPLFQIAPHTPPALDRLVLAMLEKDPTQRPAIAQVRAELAEIRAQPLVGATTTAQLSSARGTTTPPPAAGSMPSLGSEPPPARRKKRGLVIALASVAVLGAGAAGAFALVTREEHPAPPRKEHVALPQASEHDVTTAVTATTPIEKPPEPELTPTSPTATATPTPTPTPTPTAAKKPQSTPTTTPTKKPDPTTPATVTVHLGDAARGRIFVDGRRVAIGVQDYAVQLEPGKHKLRAASGPGGGGPMQSVTVTAGQQLTITLETRSRRSGADYDDEEPR
ncbi:MAG TPA: serine/threonine-protein kinase [Kofleriaceae bacterium]|nr:serine/threonine-protein kinase [Kofleriaceae bacterium]